MWWIRIGSERREMIRQRIRQNTHVLVGGGAGVVVLALYAYESHVVVCPYTGRKKFVALTPQQGGISIAIFWLLRAEIRRDLRISETARKHGVM